MDSLLSEQGAHDIVPKEGELRQGTVVSITRTEILIDIGAKSEGMINQREFASMDDAQRNAMQIGQQMSVCVEGEEDGTLIVSREKAENRLAWTQIEQMLKEKTPHTSDIASYNKGGLVVNVGRLQGFLPASQISYNRRKIATGDTPSDKWAEMVGEEITVKVIEADQKRNRLIVSERAAYKESRDAQRAKLMEELRPGQVCKGRVTSLTNWGAFVDIGGTDGLIHVSELSWRRIDHPGDVLKIRQEIEVKVLSIDEDRKRITLSRKALEDNPWLEIDQTFQEGQLVDGIITRLTKFGAFASIDGNELVEGLIHISEMSEHRIEHPEEVVREGEKLSLRIIKLDPKNNRLRLSIKAVTSALYADLDYELHFAAKGEKKVSSDDSAVSDDISVTDRQSEETTEDKSGKSEDSSTSETQTETVLG